MSEIEYILPKLKPANKDGKKKVYVHSNFLEVQIQAEQCFQYSVSIEVTFETAQGKRIVAISKSGKSYRSHIRSELCDSVLATCLTGILERTEYVYDGASALYTMEDLLDATGTEEIRRTFSISDFSGACNLFSNGAIDIKIQPCEFNKLNLHNETEKLALPSHVKQFAEITLTQAAIQSGQYLRINGLLVCSHMQQNKGAFVRTFGVAMSLRMIEGLNDNKSIVALAVDSNIQLYYPANNVISVLSVLLRCTENDIQWTVKNITRASNYLYGINLQMMESSTSSKPVKVIGLRMLDIARTTESSKKGPVLLRDLERFQDIRHDNWPVIIALTSQKIRKYYPLEKMYITPYQTISNNNEVFNQDEISLLPSERWEHIDEHIRRLHLFDNPWQNLFGIKIFPDKISLNAFRRKPPSISYSNTNASVPIDSIRCNWRSPKDGFIQSMTADSLIALSVSSAHECQIINKFGRMFIEECEKRGITFQQVISQHNNSTKRFDREWLEEMFISSQDIAKEGRTVLILYIDHERVKSHDILKYLERKYEVVTQHLTIETVSKICERKQMETLQNIINKTNKKLGGCNTRVRPLDEGVAIWDEFLADTLILSADISREGCKTADEWMPATVGFSSNAAHGEPLCFNGDFSYQAPRQEEIEAKLLRKHTQFAMKNYARTRHRLPEKLMYLRDGVSDGQVGMVMNEVEHIREASVDFARLRGELNYNPAITATMVVKRHNRRFITKDHKGELINCSPLTVVDTIVVDPIISEAYIQAHRALKGTAKAPLYRILLNEVNYTMDELQSVFIALCFGHEICSSPTSIPCAIYLADECAKRGKNLFQQLKIECPKYRKEGSYDQLNKILSYGGTALGRIRYNA